MDVLDRGSAPFRNPRLDGLTLQILPGNVDGFPPSGDVLQRLARITSSRRAGKPPQKLLETGFGVGGFVEVVPLDLADRKKGAGAVAATRILIEQKIVSIDRRLKIAWIKQAAHFSVQLAFGHQCRRSLFGV